MRPWQISDGDAFFVLNSDPEVMQDLGGPLTRDESDSKLHRYIGSYEESGYCRWAVEDQSGELLGYTGISCESHHPSGKQKDIGWRFAKHAWGKGYATEAAKAALQDGFNRVGLNEILAITAHDNFRSQALMAKLKLSRTPSLDYFDTINGQPWHGLVWSAHSEE